MTPNLYRLSNEFEINFIYTMKCSWEVYQDGEKCYSMKFLPQYLLLQITRVMDFFGRATDLFGRSAWLRLEAEATSIFFFFFHRWEETHREREGRRWEGEKREGLGKERKEKLKHGGERQCPVWRDMLPGPFTSAVKLPNTQDKWCGWTCTSLGRNQLKSWMSANWKSSLYVQLNFCKSYVRACLKGISNESFNNMNNSCPRLSGW